MKKQIFYIHGGESYENTHDFLKRLSTKDIWDLPTHKKFVKWTKTLTEDLGSEYEVFMPQMPNAQNAKYNEWKIWFERHFPYLHDGVVLVGCSLGAMFLLKYFTESKTPFTVKELIVMAAALSGRDLDVKDCGDFLPDSNALNLVQEKVSCIKILHSKDDFLVPYEHALTLKKIIPTAELITFEDKNHFLVPEFHEFIEMIKGLG